ncbi:MAG: hypothetical protein ACE5HL_12345 [Terriglobia bacterium]
MEGSPEEVLGTRSFTVSNPVAPAAGRALPSSLEGAWIEIFRAGDYGERGTWTLADLDRLAASYTPRLQAAPVVLGHPADDAPAYAWISRLRRAGNSLWAQLQKVDPAFEALLCAGRFTQRSVALYTHFPPTGGPYLRHLGFLGAAPPAVKALSPVRFAEAASVCFSFGNSAQATLLSPAAPLSRAETRDAAGSPEASMPDTKSKLENFLDHLRAFFTAERSSEPGRAKACPLPADAPAPEVDFAESIAQLQQRLDALATDLATQVRRTKAEKDAAEEKLNQTESTRRQEQTAHFVETLRAQGRFPPAFDLWGVPQFMEHLAAADSALEKCQDPSQSGRGAPHPLGMQEEQEKGSGDESAKADSSSAVPATAQQALLAWFQEFLTKLPAVIEFRELGPSTSYGPARRSPPGGAGSRLVHFTEPRRGMTIDPASVELAERAEALAAELGISYGEALTQLREEHHSSITTT